MRHKRTLLAALAILAAGAIAAACGGEGGPASPLTPAAPRYDEQRGGGFLGSGGYTDTTAIPPRGGDEGNAKTNGAATSGDDGQQPITLPGT